MHIHAYMHTYIHTYVHTYIHTHTCIHTYTPIHTYMYNPSHFNSVTAIIRTNPNNMAQIVTLVTFRTLAFMKEGKQWLMWDFCYWSVTIVFLCTGILDSCDLNHMHVFLRVNFLFLYYLWYDPGNAQIFQACVALSQEGITVVCLHKTIFFFSSA